MHAYCILSFLGSLLLCLLYIELVFAGSYFILNILHFCESCFMCAHEICSFQAQLYVKLGCVCFIIFCISICSDLEYLLSAAYLLCL